MSRIFTGVDYLQIDSALLSGPPITMAAFFKNQGVFSLFPFMLTLYTQGSTDHRYSLFMLDTGAVGAAARDTAGAAAASSTTVADGNWHHGCAVFASTTSRAAYLDGGSKGTDATSITPSGMNRTSIGAWSNGANEGLTGLIAHAAIWNVALSDGEVAQLAAGRPPPTIQPANLVLYQPMLKNQTPQRSVPFNASPFVVYGARFSNDNPTVDPYAALIGGRVASGG